MSTGQTDAPKSVPQARTAPVAYLFTTFGRPSETFLRRELNAMRALGVDARICSLWRGEGDEAMRTVPLREMLTLNWHAWAAIVRHPAPCRELLERMLDRDIPGWINFGENWQGLGCAILLAGELRRAGVTRTHAVWSSMPAAAAWLIKQIAGIPYTMGAHAYDIFEHGGDWLLPIKLRDASLVHCSSFAARDRVLACGCDPEKVVVIRRGLNDIPASTRPLRADRARCLRLVSVGRLVEKKGLRMLLDMLGALRATGQNFEARIVGSGPLETELRAAAQAHGLAERVAFTGWLGEADVNTELDRADAFLFTGRVAASGDRDGLPNALAEAMARGTPVLTTAVGAISEVIRHGENGLLLPDADRSAWLAALHNVATDDDLCEKMRKNAHAWIVEHFDAKRNAARLLEETRKRIDSAEG